jgi:pimeloyl-ACP methyl ester carboxylesterase
MFVAILREAVRAGFDAYVDDLCVLSEPWGFRLAEIATPTYLAYGDLDPFFSEEAARHFATALPRCSVRMCSGSGHFLGPVHDVWMLEAVTAESGYKVPV